MLFQKADLKQAVPQLNQSIAVTQQTLQVCLQHQPAPSQHHDEQEKKHQQYIVGNYTTFCEQSWFIYMGTCFEASQSKAGKRMSNLFTAVPFQKCHLNATTEQCLGAQSVNPISTVLRKRPLKYTERCGLF